MASRALADLDSRLLLLVKSFLEKCNEIGLEPLIIQTYRSCEEQDEDYARGRTKPGNRITNAKGGQSPHNCILPDGSPAARAFDFALYIPGTKDLDWNASDDQWKKAIAIGLSLGLVSGSTFKTIKDCDHFELPNWKDTLPMVVAQDRAPDPSQAQLRADLDPGLV